MALVVESSAITSGYGTTAVITKPAGLATGDLMIALLEANSASTTINLLSGWTEAASQALSYSDVSIQYKVADAGDVAASNFTFTDTGGARIGGGILRVSGASSTPNVPDFETNTYDSTATASVSFTTTLDPIVDGSLVVAVIAAMQGTNTGPETMSGQSMTPAITLTELFDQGAELGNNVDPQGSGVYGIQTTKAQITNYSATLSATKARHIGAIVVFSPQVDEVGTNTLLEVSPTQFSQAGIGGTTGSSALLEVSPTQFAQNGQATSPTQWSNEAKPSTSWTNET